MTYSKRIPDEEIKTAGIGGLLSTPFTIMSTIFAALAVYTYTSWSAAQSLGKATVGTMSYLDKPNLDAGTLRNMVFQDKLIRERGKLQKEKERLLAQHIRGVLDKEYGLNV